jgi:hypothetical protein
MLIKSYIGSVSIEINSLNNFKVDPLMSNFIEICSEILEMKCIVKHKIVVYDNKIVHLIFIRTYTYGVFTEAPIHSFTNNFKLLG